MADPYDPPSPTPQPQPGAPAQAPAAQAAPDHNALTGSAALLREIFRSLGSALAGVAGTLAARFGELTRALADAQTPLGRLVRLFGVPAAIGGAIGAVGGAVGRGASAVGRAGESFWQFQQLGAGISSLLSAFNPGLTQALSYSLRELQAAFGLLVQPIAQELVPLFRELAATLAPAFRTLAPVLGAVARAFGALLNTLAELFGVLVEAFAPTFQVLAQGFADLMDALGPLFVLLGAIGRAIAPIVQALAGGLVYVFQGLAHVVLFVTASLLQLFGATKTLDDMIRSLEPKDRMKSAGLQALTNPQYSSYADLGRNLAQQSAIAQGGMERPKTESEFRALILKELKDIKEGKTGIIDMIAKGVAAGLRLAAQGAYSTTQQAAADLVSPAVELARRVRRSIEEEQAGYTGEGGDF